MTSSNKWENGRKSIRIDGRRIDDLPFGQGNEAKEGLVEFIKTDKLTKSENVKAKYPKHKIAYLESRIKECEQNIVRIKEFKNELKGKIATYRQLIKDCDYRKQELDKYDADSPQDAKVMKELRLKYPPYDIGSMEQQISQFEDGIDRSDDVIEKDYNSIAEIRQVLGLAEQRDKELKSIG